MGGQLFKILHIPFIFSYYTFLMRILLVEDEHKISAYVKRGLEESGHAVDAVYTGKEAFEWAESAPYDAIILDILMPEMDGLTACQELRQRDDRTPILMLTARDTVNDHVAGLDVGANDYLVKPFPLEQPISPRSRWDH